MFNAVTNKEGITTVMQLAHEIWPEHYQPIIGTEQVDYMLKTYHSSAIVTEQIEQQHFQYFLIRYQDKSVGYFAFQCRDRVLFLSKYYLLSGFRGLGLGRKAMDFIVQCAQQQTCAKISLTVNKHNCSSIDTYYKMGFVKTNEICADIGNGFVMDDFELELAIK